MCHIESSSLCEICWGGLSAKNHLGATQRADHRPGRTMRLIERGHMVRGRIEKRRIQPRQRVRALSRRPSRACWRQSALRSADFFLRYMVRGALSAGAALLDWACSCNEPRRPKGDVDKSHGNILTSLLHVSHRRQAGFRVFLVLFLAVFLAPLARPPAT